MQEKLQFYIDGKWVDPVEPKTLEVVNPATEEAYGVISLGSAADVDVAARAAARAFESFAETSREDRRESLRKVSQTIKEEIRSGKLLTQQSILERAAGLGLGAANQLLLRQRE